MDLSLNVGKYSFNFVFYPLLSFPQSQPSSSFQLDRIGPILSRKKADAKSISRGTLENKANIRHENINENEIKVPKKGRHL